MSTYIHFTEEQRRQARETDLVAFLHSQGEQTKRSGSERQWREGSQKVTIRGNLWFHQYERAGGDAVDFVRRYYGKNYPEAVSMLLGMSLPTALEKSNIVQEKKQLELPPRARQIRHAFSYLCGVRGLDPEIVSAFVNKGMIYESSDHHSVVFLGFDKEGTPRHAHKRGTIRGSAYKGNAVGSDPAYSFHYFGKDNRLFLFESPIDMLSYLSLHPNGWQAHSYAAACGVSEHVLWQMLEANPKLDTVFLCRDNDQPGQEANQRTAAALKEKNIPWQILVPTCKDWNEDLLYTQNMEEGPCREQML